MRSRPWWTWKFYKNKGIAEGRKHRRYKEVVQSCIRHSCESWSWNEEMVDMFHGWESRNLDLMSLRRWAQTGMNLEWFRANQIRRARQRLLKEEERTSNDKKRNKETDRMMENILKHANPEWREQRSTCAKILDPKHHDKMRRRRAGVVHTNWHNLRMKWSGCQRWWEVTKRLEKLCKNSWGTMQKNTD